MPTITPPFQRRITNPLQRPVAADLNLQAFYDSVTQAYLAGAVYSGSPSASTPTFRNGFVGNSFRPKASATSRAVVVLKGIGFLNASTAYDTEGIDGIAGVNAGAYAPVVCQPDSPTDEGVSLAVDALAAGFARIDAIVVKAPELPADYQSIGLLNPASSTFSFAEKPQQFTENVASGQAQLSPASLRIVTGSAVALPATPTVPTVPVGYTLIGFVRPTQGAGLVSDANLQDARSVLVPGGNMILPFTFGSHITAPVGYDFGNGYQVVVNPVYSVPPDQGQKTFDVYVAGNIDLSLKDVRVVAGSCTSGFQTLPNTWANAVCAVDSSTDVSLTRNITPTEFADAQALFDAAGFSVTSMGQYINRVTCYVGYPFVTNIQEAAPNYTRVGLLAQWDGGGIDELDQVFATFFLSVACI
jgi:hypothetical protein